LYPTSEKQIEIEGRDREVVGKEISEIKKI